MNADLLIQYALKFVGTPYKWGGSNPIEGYDCSGFVLELMAASGVWPHGLDANCQAIFNEFRKRGYETPLIPVPASVVFFGSGKHNVSHIGFCIDDQRMIEAGGGNSETNSRDDAVKRNAFVRIRPIKYRKDCVDILYPTYS